MLKQFGTAEHILQVAIMKSNSFERHLIALAITVVIYKIHTSTVISALTLGLLSEETRAHIYFPLHAAWSIPYSILIYSFAKTRLTNILMFIEIISVVYTIFAYAQWFLSSKSQWFYINFDFIMWVCFLFELIAIMIGATHGGIHRIIQIFRKRHLHDHYYD